MEYGMRNVEGVIEFSFESYQAREVLHLKREYNGRNMGYPRPRRSSLTSSSGGEKGNAFRILFLIPALSAFYG